MAFVQDGMSPTGLAGPGATSVMPKGMGSGAGAVKPPPQPVPANNQPMKATPQGVQGAAAAQSQAPPQQGPVPGQGMAPMPGQQGTPPAMPPLYTPGVNGPVVNDQNVPPPTAIRGSTMTPQPGRPEQVGQFIPPSVQALMQPKAAEIIPGGKAQGLPTSIFPQEQLQQGRKVELEHTSSKPMATEIAKDHLTERPDYYDRLAEAEDAPIKAPSGSQEGSQDPDSVLGGLFGFKPKQGSQELVSVPLSEVVKAAEEFTTYHYGDEIPVRWGKWRMDGLDALEDLERHMTSKAKASGFKSPLTKQAAGPMIPGLAPIPLARPGDAAKSIQQIPLARPGDAAKAIQPIPNYMTPGRSLAETMPWNSRVFDQPFETPKIDVGALNLSPRSLDIPSPGSKPMLEGGQALPKLEGGWMDNPAVQEAAKSFQMRPTGMENLGGGPKEMPPVTAKEVQTAKLLSPVTNKTPAGPVSTPSSVAATPTTPSATPLTTSTGPAPTPTGPATQPAPVGRYSHLIAELQQKIPQMEARMATMDPNSRQYANAQRMLESAKYRMGDLDKRQWTTAKDFPTASPQALNRFQQDAAKYQSKADAFAAKPPAGGAKPAPAPAAGSVAALTKPALPPQAPKMAEVLAKISTYPGCGMAKKKKKRRKMAAADAPSISPFAAAFFLRCCVTGMSEDGIRDAVKVASASHPAFADELTVLVADNCPVLEDTFEFVKDAAMPNLSSLWRGVSPYIDDAGRAIGNLFRRGGVQAAGRAAAGSADDLAGAASRGVAGAASHIPTPPVMPPSAPTPSAIQAATSRVGQAGAAGRSAAADAAMQGATAIRSGATPPPGADPSFFQRYVSGPAGKVTGPAWNWLGRPAAGGLGGYWAGNAVNAGLGLAGINPVPGLPATMAALGGGSQLPFMPSAVRSTVGRAGMQGVLPMLGAPYAAQDISEAATRGFTNVGDRFLQSKGIDLKNPESIQRLIGIDPKAIQQINQMGTPEGQRALLAQHFPILNNPMVSRVFDAFKEKGIVGGLMAGWKELTPMQQAGLLTALGGLGVGLGAAAFGHPGLGAAIGLGGLGAGGVMGYMGSGDPIQAAMRGASPEALKQLRGMVDPQLWPEGQDVPSSDMFGGLQQLPRSQQASQMQQLMQMLQQQQAGAEVARSAGQPTPATQ